MSRNSEPLNIKKIISRLKRKMSPTREIELDAYQIRFFRWQADANDFAQWTLDGVEFGLEGTIKLSADISVGEGGVLSGEMISPVLEAGFEISSAVPSWNVEAPVGSWIKVFLRAKIEEAWTKWYSLGIWSQSNDPSDRHSLTGQDDERVEIATDTLKIREGENASAIQMKIEMNSRSDSQYPVIHELALVVDNRYKQNCVPSRGDPVLWNKNLPVPAFSQMVYPDGGNAWCSPVSVAMVLAFWQDYKGVPELLVRETAAGVYDPVYEGTGNWPYNTAYAASKGMSGAVSRLLSLEEAEKFIRAGIPLVMSLSWKPGELTGAPLEKSDGHLVVLAGFDPQGNPVVNDPAASEDSLVQRTYPRREFEKQWRTTSGGVVYIITPPGINWPIEELLAK